MDCCKSTNRNKKCIRKKDNKVFKLPRKFTKKRCMHKIRGFTMKSSCAPYKYCKRTKKKQFLYNPNNPKKSFDVYIDKNPNDTISIKYKTVSDIKDTINKLERLYRKKKYPHKRIWQVGMIMKVRLEAINKYKNTKFRNAKNVTARYNLAKKYFNFLGSRTKKKTFTERSKLKFKIETE